MPSFTTNQQHEEAIPDFWALSGCDIVLIPSMTVSFYEAKALTSVHEERHIVLLNLLKNTDCRIIFVISSALEADIIKYRLAVYSEAYNDSTAEERLILLEAKDTSNRALTEKILENEPLMEEIRRSIRNPDKAWMLSYICSPLDEELRNRLGLKRWFGSAPSNWGTKSGSRQIFRESGVPIAEGTMAPIFKKEILEREILHLQNRTKANRIIVKVDDGSGGYGNVVLDFSEFASEVTTEHVVRVLRKSVETLLPFDGFVEQLEECGAIIEQMVDPKGKEAIQTTPSVQLYIRGDNDVQVLSSHEQVIDGCYYMGCKYPANENYLDVITRYGKAAGEAMSLKGVRGFCGVDFLATKNNRSDLEWDIVALEINLRLVATTFSYFSLLTIVDESLVSKKHYVHLDEIILRDSFRTVPDLEREVEKHGLGFNSKKGTGIMFTTLSRLRSDREVGVMCVGDSDEEADRLYHDFMRELADEHQPSHSQPSVTGPTEAIINVAPQKEVVLNAQGVATTGPQAMATA